jgi:hypothetical protein
MLAVELYKSENLETSHKMLTVAESENFETSHTRCEQ